MKMTRWALVLALVLGLRSRRGAAATTRRSPRGGGANRPRRRPRSSSSPRTRRMGKIQEKGEITIGVKYDVPPFGFKNPQTDEVEGFDVDFGKAVADKLGVEPKFVEAISDNRIPFLQDGTVDLILSTMTINAERVAGDRLLRARTSSRSGRILVPEDSDITGVDDLAGKKVCTALGSTYEATLKEQAPEAKLQARRLLLGVPGAGAERRRRRGLDRRRDPHRHDHPGRHAQARRRRADQRALRRRHQAGRRPRWSGVRQRRLRGVQGRAAAGPRPTTSGSASTPASSRSRRR